ncbi:MAG: cupin domain-containing protein [Melioribacteraceae bacterium]|nr:cupin domain-containing protein [Melioribacteraceae bacterium]
MNSINIKEKLIKISEHWSPKIIARMNDYHFKLAKIKGEFVWHKHEDTDETFIVIEGKMKILLRDGGVKLSEGEIYVVPKGIEHKPVAESECSILLIELAGTVNTGEIKSELTKSNLEWI